MGVCVYRIGKVFPIINTSTIVSVSLKLLLFIASNILSFYRFARDYPEPPDDLCKLTKKSRVIMLDHELSTTTTAAATAATTTTTNYCINTEISIWRIGNGL